MSHDAPVSALEKRLSDFDPKVRRESLENLAGLAERGKLELPPPGANVNMHMHTFFSFNAEGWSPSRIAWEARKAGLLVAGIVDFDVLDGLGEFLEAGDVLELRAAVGVESRVFVGDLAEKEINSPGEPGIAYYMGTGFHRLAGPGSAGAATLRNMRGLARRRNEGMAERINRHLGEAAIDYERDVLPLAPSFNATERHMLVAYERKAEEALPDVNERARYWAAKLGEGVDESRVVGLLTGGEAGKIAFRETLRARLMKKGGVGYATPERGSFPTLEEMAGMAASCGALPTGTWLDGTSAGETGAREVVEFHASKGAVALNIIPDRNWNLKDAKAREIKLGNLYDIVRAAREANLVLVSGTELNKPGLPFVDDLSCEALSPIAEAIREGALALYGHTAMARSASRPLGGEWARAAFGDDAAARNRFYAEVGRLVEPGPDAAGKLRAACEADGPDDLLAALRAG